MAPVTPDLKSAKRLDMTKASKENSTGSKSPKTKSRTRVDFLKTSPMDNISEPSGNDDSSSFEVGKGIIFLKQSQTINLQFIMEQCQDLRKLSMELYSVFDRSGFNEFVRKFKYTIDSILGVLHYDGKNQTVGSMAEGTYMDTSDIDILVFNKDKLLVGYKPQDADPDTPYLHLVRANSTPAGYTKLQIYLNGKPCHENDVIHLESYFNHEIDVGSDKQCFLSNRRTITHTERDKSLNAQYHGPASTFEANLETWDAVLAYESEHLPNYLNCWFERTRLYNWPSSTTCDVFHSMGCCYVGVGHSSSPEQYLEWRISPTRQELYLMMNLNPTQFRCYILLKTLKQFIQRPSDNGISSYHCKTALFYTIENNDSDIWQPYHLIECVFKCLNQLLVWVTRKKCPNYFISEENMFETKLIDKTVIKRLELLRLPSTYLTIHNNIFSVISNSRKESAAIDQNVVALKRSLSYVLTDVASATDQINNMEHFIRIIKSSPCDSIQIFESFVSPHKINMDILLAMITEKLYQLNRHKHLKTARSKLSDTDVGVIPYLQDKSKKSHQDYEYCLKLASIAAAQREYSMCDALIQNVYEIAITIKTICSCRSFQQVNPNDNRIEYNRSIMHLVNVVDYSNSDGKCLNTMFIKGLLQQFTICLKFYEGEYEAGMIIPPLHFDAYKTVGIPPEYIDISYRLYTYRELLSIHHAAYTHFLQYKNSGMLSKKGDMCLALEKLEHMNLVGLREWKYCHPDTTLNLLGHIYTTKGWYRLALRCLKRSWKMLTHYNAAKWHIMFMLFRYTLYIDSSQK